jgi:glycosyltransferase involved in cell wall biosynthesis
VGALEPRKAPELLLRAHARARGSGLDAELAFAGSGRLSGRLRRGGARLLGPVAGAELDALYAGALALVMPSWLEGFGWPPLEALARGTPALVSDLPVFRETLGDAALRFPAGDERALSDALVRIGADPELRRRLVAAGRESLASLTWDRAAQRAREVLAEAAEERP